MYRWMWGDVMGETTEYPKIADWLPHLDAHPNATFFGNTSKPHKARDLATELRALLADRDALKAKAPPARKLREYKGVTFRDGKWWVRDSAIHAEPRGHVGHSSVANLLFFLHTSFTDADHAAIYALREQPYEPAQTVEDVVRGIIDGSTMCRASLAQTCARLRAAVAAEMAQGEGR
ncbi:MAG: hypothetical protein ACK6DP_11020 [Gemmatimonas sp.]|uniref:hypothetical protein n=1 Tax=Gemmatimonas sp. TaxID=1962908 RepID=UPI00391EF73A